ncbi:COL8A [Mytilus edulis]|uniref:COL8A n=1 Tax=Mytilus edulis TaxID=6550 RepID=A0A8S3QMM1_MYTED|nr:COL8A [Mytilus edulis]
MFLALLPLFWSPAQSKACCSNNKLMRSIKYQFNLMNPDECGGETSGNTAYTNYIWHRDNKHREAYDKTTGVFTSPRDGTFYFSWTMYTNPGGSCPTELVQNSKPAGFANHTWNEGTKWNHSSTQSGVLTLKKHDKIWIRMQQTGKGYCYGGEWTSFNGFEI